MRIFFSLAIVAAIILVFFVTAGPPDAEANPPGTFAFAALGDAPYDFGEALQHRIVRRSIDAHDLAFVVHVGDIWWRPCSDAMYRKTREQFDAMRHPVIYTPGDNEWTDCWEPYVGGYAPLERLAFLRKVFYPIPNVTSQGGEFLENVRWERDGITFATLHVVGTANGMQPFPSRTIKDDENARRMQNAALQWLRETFAHAKSGVVLALHGNVFEGDAYAELRGALDEEVARYGKPVLVIHGDHHDYTVDHPLRPNLTRLMVPGSPHVGWVRVIVRPGPHPTWSFEPYVVPRWKYW